MRASVRRFGAVRSIGSTRPSCMEVLIDQGCGGAGNTRHAFEVFDARLGDGSGRAEIVQQRALARRADAGDLVERRALRGLAASRPVRADREAMCLIAQ